MKLLQEEQEYEDILTDDAILSIAKCLSLQVNAIRKEKSNFNRRHECHFIVSELELKAGGTMNGKVKYLLELFPTYYDVLEMKTMLFDEMPDEILDNYNEIKNHKNAVILKSFK